MIFMSRIDKNEIIDPVVISDTISVMHNFMSF